MTGQDIKVAAEAYIGETIAASDALAAINEALRTLADAAELYAETQLTASQDNEWVSLPSNITSVISLKNAEGKPVTNAFRQGLYLRLPKAGTYTLRYKRLPQQVSDLNQAIDLPDIFQQALVDYAIAWWKLKDDEENPDGKAKMQAFLERAREAVFALRRQRWPRDIQVVRDGRHEAGLYPSSMW